MNISKQLKKKRDAEARLQKQSPTPSYSSDGTNESYIDLYKLATKNDLAAKSDKDHVHEIVDLTDVAITYTANAGKFLKVNATENGVDLGEASGGGASTFVDLSDTPSVYTGQSGKVPTVKSTEDGLEFSNGPAAANGIPVGGTENQLVAKNSLTDYDVKWMDAPSGGGMVDSRIGMLLPDSSGALTTAQPANWSRVVCLNACTVKKVHFAIGALTGNIKLKVGEISTLSGADTVTNWVYDGSYESTDTPPTVKEFAGLSITLEKNKIYAFVFQSESGTTLRIAQGDRSILGQGSLLPSGGNVSGSCARDSTSLSIYSSSIVAIIIEYE